MKKIYHILLPLFMLFPALSLAANMEQSILDDEFDDEEIIEIADPLEPINRAFFGFNDILYSYALKPVAKAVRYIPEPARIALKNFVSNLTTPIRFINSLLQGKFSDAGTEGGRFAINSIIGILGLFDPAREMDIYKKDEDSGQTLGYYGVGQGFYLVIPFIGPSSLRDSIGLVANYYMDPLSLLSPERDYYIAQTGIIINEVSLDKDTYESIKKEQLDPYLFIRDAYAQHRQGKVEE
ncbi:MAG: VacJ family lipoprotein [Gammaproteobacteria bacterium]|nr:VacJ family lipoprotein [Gammaproteobacteria bacterium]